MNIKKIGLLILMTLLFLIPLSAKNYGSLKASLKAVLPAHQKIYKRSLKLTKEHAKKLNTFGEGDFIKGESFTIYYTKNTDGSTHTAAVEIMEILTKYQAIHIWVIGIKPDGTRTGMAVRELTDHYSFPLAETSFTDRFPSRIEEKSSREITSIDVIAGATESSYLLRYSVKRTLYILELAGLS